MRTLFLSADFKPAGGGIAELYLNLLLRFPPGAVEVSTVRAPAGWRDRYPFPVRRERFGFRESSRLQNVVRWTLHARRLVRASGHGVLQIGTLRPAGAVGAWLQRLDAVPFLVYVHGKDVLKEHAKAVHSRPYRSTTRDLLRRAGAFVANSRFTAERLRELAEAAGVPAATRRIRVVHPGADPVRFRPGDAGVAELRGRLGLGGARVVVTVARLAARKGVDRALEAVAALVPEFPDLVYVVVGDGSQRSALERRAAAPDLAGRVRFVGWVGDEELPAFYRLGEVFLLPSRRERGDEAEGFGIVLSEAGASGVPVIGGDSGGVRDAVRDGETGLLVDPESSDAVAGALRRLLGDPVLAERLGRGGREWVERYYNWDRAAREAWAIVEEVAEMPVRGHA